MLFDLIYFGQAVHRRVFMKNKINFVSAAFLMLSCLITSSFALNWTLVWSDEFNTPGLPDSSKWSYDVGGDGWGNNELQYYTNRRTENSRIEDSALIIELRKENFSGKNYTSARLVSNNKGDWLYGRVEVRAKLPSGLGTWPAIWMLSTDKEYGSWPASGEIDIMEHVGFDPGVIHATVHTDSLNHIKGTQVGKSTNVNDFSTSFHIYTLEWFADHIDVYVDNLKYFTFENKSKGFRTWPFDKRFHLILNTAFGGNWGGAQGIDSSLNTASFYIDYVRVFQVVQEGPISLSVNSSSGGTFSVNPQKTQYASGDDIAITAIADTGYEFKFWSGDILSYTSPLKIKIYRNTSIRANFVRNGEMIIDGGFDNGLTEWTEWSNTGTSAVREVNDGRFEIKISEAGTNDWDLQLSQDGMNLIAGHKYLMSFRSWSLNSRTITVRINMTVSPYGAYSSKVFSISANPATYKHEFTMPDKSDSNARVEFDFGQSAITTFIDDVSLMDISITGTNGNRENHFNGNRSTSKTPVKKVLIETGLINQGYDLLGKHMKTESSVRRLSRFSNGIYLVPQNISK